MEGNNERQSRSKQCSIGEGVNRKATRGRGKEKARRDYIENEESNREF